MCFWILFITLNSAIATADNNCKRLFNSFSALERRLEFKFPGDVIAIDQHKPLTQLTFELKRGSEVNVSPQKDRNRDGDEIIIWKRSDSQTQLMYHQMDTRSLLGKLLTRYYLSRRIPMRLLPGASRLKLQEGKENLDQLLSLEQVLHPKLPSLRPASAEHEDYHLSRLEFNRTHHWREDFESLEEKIQDLPAIKVDAIVSYKFLNHGDSHKSSSNFVGQRLELITEYVGPSQEIAIYHKARMNKEGNIVARSLVFKSAKKTIRIRLAIGKPLDIDAIIKEVLGEQFHAQQIHLYAHKTVLRMRRSVAIVLGSNLRDAIEIGRLSVDSDLALQKTISEETLSGKQKLLDKSYRDVTAIDDLGFALEHSFQTQKIPNHIQSEKMILSLTGEKTYETEMGFLIRDLQKFLHF